MGFKSKPQGNIIITIVFVLFISMLGISLLTFCFAHTAIIKARTIKGNEIEKMNSVLVHYLHGFREEIFKENINNYIFPEKEYFNTVRFPPTFIDSRYKLTHTFETISYLLSTYKKTCVNDTVHLEIGCYSYILNAGVSIDILSGKIPVDRIPIFVDKSISVPEEVFLSEKGIENKSGKNSIVGSVSAELNVSNLLKDMLNTQVDILSWNNLRTVFFFPQSSEPFPIGIYILIENGVVDTVFIQGNADRVIFSADKSSGIQKVNIYHCSSNYEFSYKPLSSFFKCWNNSIPQGLLFKEKIIVNGDISSIEQGGDIAFLGNTNISILVTGMATITTNLESESQTDTLDKKSSTHLKLVCTKDTVLNGGNAKNDVIISKKDNTIIQASIIANGKFSNSSPLLSLSGSLYCKEIENTGKITVDFLSSGDTKNTNCVTKDYKYIDRFLIRFIEEVTDGTD